MSKWIRRTLSILILFGVGYTIYPLFVGASKMEQFCAAVEVGEPMKDILDRAATKGYGHRELTDQQVMLIIDSRAMGRFICEISISDSQTTGARYVFND
jgi:hypothetical protein